MKTYNWFKPGAPTQVAVTFSCVTAFVLWGYDQGVFGSLVTNPGFLDVTGHPNTAYLGIIVSCYNIGCLMGSACSFFVGHKYGRKESILVAMICVSIGAILQCTTGGVPQLMVGRIITGLGIGIDTATVPMYQSELCKREKRGSLVGLAMVFVASGIVAAYFFDYGLSFVESSLSWRLPIACQTIIALIVICAVPGLPESPRYLIQKDRTDEAVLMLSMLWDLPSDDEAIIAEKDEIVAAKALENAKPFRWGHIMRQDAVRTRWRLFLSFLLLFMNQWTGITVLIFYAPTVLQHNVGLSRPSSLIAGGCINLGTVIGATTSASLLDRVGRRKPLIIGTIIQPICMMLFAVMLSFQGTDKQAATSKAAIAFILLYMIAFSASTGSIPYCYSTEILPLHVRAQGTALSMFGNWTWVFIIVMVTPTLVEKLQWKAYLIFMAFGVIFVPMLYFWYPETKNLSLEEIDYLFLEPGHDVTRDVKPESSQHMEVKV